jgi:hypothetical protein
MNWIYPPFSHLYAEKNIFSLFPPLHSIDRYPAMISQIKDSIFARLLSLWTAKHLLKRVKLNFLILLSDASLRLLTDQCAEWIEEIDMSHTERLTHEAYSYFFSRCKRLRRLTLDGFPASFGTSIIDSALLFNCFEQGNIASTLQGMTLTPHERTPCRSCQCSLIDFCWSDLKFGLYVPSPERVTWMLSNMPQLWSSVDFLSELSLYSELLSKDNHMRVAETLCELQPHRLKWRVAKASALIRVDLPAALEIVRGVLKLKPMHPAACDFMMDFNDMFDDEAHQTWSHSLRIRRLKKFQKAKRNLMARPFDIVCLSEAVEDFEMTGRSLIADGKTGEALEVSTFLLDRVNAFQRPENSYPIESMRKVPIQSVLPMHAAILWAHGQDRILDAYAAYKELWEMERKICKEVAVESETLASCSWALLAMTATIDELREDLPGWLEHLGAMNETGRYSSTPTFKKTMEAVLEKRCTLHAHGRKFVPQLWFQCHTCRLVGGNGICAGCAVGECHKGHRVVYKYFSSSAYCDCAVHDESQFPKREPNDEYEYISYGET